MPRAKGKWRGGRQCQVCKHPECGRIDYLIVSGGGGHGSGRRALAQKFGVTEISIWNHGKNHISPEYRQAVLAGPLRSENDLRELVAEEGISVLQNFRAIFNGHRSRWLNALETGSDEVMISHGRAMAEMLWKIGRLTREIASPQTFVQNNTVQIFEHPEYLSAITVLTAALRPFPEARKAAAEALRALDAKQNAVPLIEAKAVS
jgi:hypothetical protein